MEGGVFLRTGLCRSRIGSTRVLFATRQGIVRTCSVSMLLYSIPGSGHMNWVGVTRAITTSFVHVMCNYVQLCKHNTASITTIWKKETQIPLSIVNQGDLPTAHRVGRSFDRFDHYSTVQFSEQCRTTKWTCCCLLHVVSKLDCSRFRLV